MNPSKQSDIARMIKGKLSNTSSAFNRNTTVVGHQSKLQATPTANRRSPGKGTYTLNTRTLTRSAKT